MAGGGSDGTGPAGADSVSPAAVPSIPSAREDADMLAERIGADALAVGEPLGQTTVLLKRERLLETAAWLQEERGYQLLRSITAVDFETIQPRFQVVYHFLALPDAIMQGRVHPAADAPLRALRLKVPVTAEDPVVPSLVGLYPTANWLEREVWDLFGIEFADHPDMRRILLPDAFEGHPLRKDHPIEYEEIAFTFNQEEIYAQKPFAKK